MSTAATPSSAEVTTTTPAPKRKPVFVKVSDLKPGTIGHTLVVKVVSSMPVVSKGPNVGAGGGRTMVPLNSSPKARIAECVVGDETGTIIFTARNEQVDMLKPDATVILRNSRIDMFKGSMRLAVDKWGRVEVTEPADFVVKEDNNLSQSRFCGQISCICYLPLSGYYHTRSAVAKFRTEAVYVEFMKQWKISLRFQETPGALDESLRAASLISVPASSSDSQKPQDLLSDLLLRQSTSLLESFGGSGNGDDLVGPGIGGGVDGVRPLVNLGNSCYFNAALQMLLSIQWLIDALDDSTDILVILRGILNPDASMPHESLYNSLCDDPHSNFSPDGGYSQDVLLELLNMIHDSFTEDGRSWMMQVFTSEEMWKCTSCNNKKPSELRQFINLYPNQWGETVSFLLRKTNEDHCMECNDTTLHRRTFEGPTLPRVIFMINYRPARFITSEQIVDVRPLYPSVPDSVPTRFELKSIIVHTAFGGGHLYAYVKRGLDWYLADDSHVERVNWDAVYRSQSISQLGPPRQDFPLVFAYEEL